MEEEKTGRQNIEQVMVEIINTSQTIAALENLLKEKNQQIYDLEGITVSDENDIEMTMGDLHRKRRRLLQELQGRLSAHKLQPYVGSDYEDIIAKIAAAMLDDADMLENQLRREFEDKVGSLIKRYGELNIFFLKQKPRNLVLKRLKEALECYVHGFFQGCAILCRSTVEVAIKEKINKKIGKKPDKTLGRLFDDAKKLRIMQDEDIALAERVKSIGDNTVHESSRCSSEQAYESLTKTKILLNRLYR